MSYRGNFPFRGRGRGRGVGRGRGRGRVRGFSPFTTFRRAPGALDEREKERERHREKRPRDEDRRDEDRRDEDRRDEYRRDEDRRDEDRRDEDRRSSSSSKREVRPPRSSSSKDLYFKPSSSSEAESTSSREVIVCKYCQKRFKDQESYESHAQTASHHNQVVSLKEYERQKNTSCASCRKVFSSREILMNHCKVSKHIPVEQDKQEEKAAESKPKSKSIYAEEREKMIQKSIERKRARDLENSTSVVSETEKQQQDSTKQNFPASLYKDHSPFYCSICCADCFNKGTYEEHTTGAQHWGNVTALEVELRKTKSSSDMLEIFAPSEIQPYYCDVCEINCQSRAPYLGHLKGKKHATRLSMLAGEKTDELFDDEEEEDPVTVELPRTKYFCDLCNVDCTYESNYNVHLKSKKHRSLSENKNSKIYCSVCDVFCPTQKHYSTHIQGKKHISSTLKVEKHGVDKDKGMGSFKDLREKITGGPDDVDDILNDDILDDEILTKGEDVVIKVTSSGHRILREKAVSGDSAGDDLRSIIKQKHGRSDVYVMHSDDEMSDLRNIIDKQRSHHKSKYDRDVNDDDFDEPKVDVPDDELYEKYISEGGTLNRSDFNRILSSIRETGEAEEPQRSDAKDSSRTVEKSSKRRSSRSGHQSEGNREDRHRNHKDSKSYGKQSEDTVRQQDYHNSLKSSSVEKYKESRKKERSPEIPKSDQNRKVVKHKKDKVKDHGKEKSYDKLAKKEIEDRSRKNKVPKKSSTYDQDSVEKEQSPELEDKNIYQGRSSAHKKKRKRDQSEDELSLDSDYSEQREDETNFKHSEEREVDTKPLSDEGAKEKLIADIAQISAKYKEDIYSEVDRQRLIYRDLVQAYPHLAQPVEDPKDYNGDDSAEEEDMEKPSGGEEPTAYELGKPFFSGGWDHPESGARSPGQHSASSHSEWSYEEDCGEESSETAQKSQSRESIKGYRQEHKKKHFENKGSKKGSPSPEKRMSDEWEKHQKPVDLYDRTRENRSQYMTPGDDSHWPPDVTPEEMRRVEDYERRTAMTDVTKTYHEKQEEILREKFGRRLDKAELTALTNINVTIKRSEAVAQVSEHGSAALREYRGGSKTDKYRQTRPQGKLERFSKTVVRSKQDVDIYTREKASEIPSDRNSKAIKRTSEGTGKKYKDKKGKRSRSYSVSSGSSRSTSRSRSSSSERSGHKPAKTKSHQLGEKGKRSDSASKENSDRSDSRSHKKSQESSSKSRSPKSKSRRRSRSTSGSRKSRSRSRSREKIIKTKNLEKETDPKKMERTPSSKTEERGRRSVSTDRGSNRSTRSKDSSGKGSGMQQKHEKEKRNTAAKDSRASSDRQENEKSTERKTEGSNFKRGSFTIQKEKLKKPVSSSLRTAEKQLSTTAQSANSIPVLTSGGVGRGRGRGKFVQYVQGVKTSAVANPGAAGKGRAVMKAPPKDSRFMKPADFVPRPFQMKMLDGKIRRPQPVLKCFADDDVDNIEKPPEKSSGSTSSGENQPVVPAQVVNIFPDEPSQIMQSTIDTTQSSGHENSEIASSTEEDSKHSRVVLPPSRKRKAQDQAESDGVEKKRIQEKTSRQQAERNQETYGPYTAQQAKQSESKRAKNSDQEICKREETRKELPKPAKQGRLIEEEDRSPKRVVVQKDSRSSSRGQREKEKEREKRKEKPKQGKEENAEKDSKRDERGRERRMEKSAKDLRKDSSDSGSAVKRLEPSPDDEIRKERERKKEKKLREKQEEEEEEWVEAPMTTVEDVVLKQADATYQYVEQYTGDVHQHARDVHQHAGDVPQHARDVPQHARNVPQHARDVPQHARDVPQHARDVPQHAREVPQHVRDVPQHAGDVPQHAREVQQHARDVQQHASDVQQHAGDVQQQHVEGTKTPVTDETYPEAATTWDSAAAHEGEWYGTGEYDADGYYYHENAEGDPYHAETQDGHAEYYTEEGGEQPYEGEYSEQYQWNEEYYQQNPDGEAVARDQGAAYDESTECNTADSTVTEQGYYEHDYSTEGQGYHGTGYEGEAAGQEYWENPTEEQQYYEGDEWAGYEGEYAEPQPVEGESNLHYGYEGDEHSAVNEQNEQAYIEQYLVEQPMETEQKPYHVAEFQTEYSDQQEEGFYGNYDSYEAQQEEQHEEPEPGFDEAELLGGSLSPTSLPEEPKPLRSILKKTKPKQKVSAPVHRFRQHQPQQQGTPGDKHAASVGTPDQPHPSPIHAASVGTPDQPHPSPIPKHDIGAEYITNITNGNRVQFYCQLCKCHFNTVTAKNLHLKGMKHIEMFIRTKANLLTAVITDVRGSPKV